MNAVYQPVNVLVGEVVAGVNARTARTYRYFFSSGDEVCEEEFWAAYTQRESYGGSGIFGGWYTITVRAMDAKRRDIRVFTTKRDAPPS
jgi:hypothetical protein